MQKSISFDKTGFFSKITTDYLNQSSDLKMFYGSFPSISNFRKQIDLKEHTSVNRSKLVAVLTSQYAGINTSKAVASNIKLLEDKRTFSITTGHQLNLFTGPLYAVYKIISAINMSEQLKDAYPSYNFVPIFWMATEDHDFDEVRFFNFKETKIVWESEQKGAVGRFSTDGLDEVFAEFSNQLNSSKNANELRELFRKAYLEHDTLATATRYLINELFKEYGLIVLDADATELKKEFIPYLKQEITNQITFKEVSETISVLKNTYKVQVNPRVINLFYLRNGLRERIILENGIYKVLNSPYLFSKKEILQELKSFPERFSPNVIMRPLYQEVVLPNLCYIGGGGELAYWFELKSCFKAMGVVFPILSLRNSVQLFSENQVEKLTKLEISMEDIFKKQHLLIAEKVMDKTLVNFDFTAQKTVLKKQFKALKQIAMKTDVSFIGAVESQEKKQLNGLANLEKRFLRAEKRRQKELVASIVNIQNNLLPKQSLEERQRNFSEYYQVYGSKFIKLLKESLNPFEQELCLVVNKNKK